MSVYNIYPASQGDLSQWDLVGGGSETSAILNDVDANYIHDITGGGRSSFHLSKFAAYVVAVSRVDIWYRLKYSGAIGACGGALRLAGVEGPQQSSGNVTVAWADYSQTDFRVNPGGAVPTMANVADVTFEMGLINITGGGNDIWCTKMYCPCQVTFVTGGGFTIIAEFLGPVLGCGVLLKEMPALIRAIYHATRGMITFHAHEAADLLADIHAYKHRRYAWQS